MAAHSGISVYALEVGFKFTGRICNHNGCLGKLKDYVLDWEDALPDEELEKAEDLAEKAVGLGI